MTIANLNVRVEGRSKAAVVSKLPASAPSRVYRGVECSVLFLGIPTVIGWGWIKVPIILLLILMGGGCWLLLRWRGEAEPGDLFGWPPTRTARIRTLTTYALAVPGLYGFLWLLRPAALFSLVTHRPALWALIMCAYPLVSVFPQEVMYRLFFFRRYECLFGKGAGMVLASGAAFSYGHIVFHNWVAVALTAAGGLLFAQTYRTTRSLPWTAIEHALYGCALFTLGYGQFLIGGMLQSAR